MEPPGSVELPLAAYKAATLRSVGGVVTSRGIEPRSLGLQPSAMTTLARWPDGADGGSRTRACALRERRASGSTSSTWSRLEDSNRDSPVIGRRSCRWTKPGGVGRDSMAVGPGFEPGPSRVTGGRVAVATTLQAKMSEVGCQAWTRTTICGVRGRCPAVGRSGNGRVGRTRTSTHLRPRQVCYRLPYDPKN